MASFTFNPLLSFRNHELRFILDSLWTRNSLFIFSSYRYIRGSKIIFLPFTCWRLICLSLSLNLLLFFFLCTIFCLIIFQRSLHNLFLLPLINFHSRYLLSAHWTLTFHLLNPDLQALMMKLMFMFAWNS
jgi:hypothetical protein